MIRNLGQRCRWLFVTGRSTSVMLARWLDKIDCQVLHLKMSNDLVPKWNSSFVSWWTTFWTTPSGHGFSSCFCFIYSFSSSLLIDTLKSLCDKGVSKSKNQLFVLKWDSSFVSWWTTFWTTLSGHGFSLCICFIYKFSSSLLIDTLKSWKDICVRS